MTTEQHFKALLQLAVDNVKEGCGPFAAAIYKNGEPICIKSNAVTSTNDPTAHAEIRAIRGACEILKTFDLSGCEIYTTCYPCPMCFGAIYWANLEAIYYCAEKRDAADAGFNDEFIYEQLALDPSDRRVKEIFVTAEQDPLKPFKVWKKKKDKIEY